MRHDGRAVKARGAHGAAEIVVLSASEGLSLLRGHFAGLAVFGASIYACSLNPGPDLPFAGGKGMMGGRAGVGGVDMEPSAGRGGGAIANGGKGGTDGSGGATGGSGGADSAGGRGGSGGSTGGSLGKGGTGGRGGAPSVGGSSGSGGSFPAGGTSNGGGSSTAGGAGVGGTSATGEGGEGGAGTEAGAGGEGGSPENAVISRTSGIHRSERLITR